MENVIQIQLGESKYVDSINQDSFIPILLKRDTSLLTEYGVNEVLNLNDQYEKERNDCKSYRVYGEIEYLSILNNIKSTYEKLEDFFTYDSNGKTILNSFDFYVVKRNNNYVEVDNIEKKYISYFETISGVTLNIFPAGYSKNIFNEQTYIYITNKLITVDNSDYNNVSGTTQLPYFPITELYIYCKYKPSNGETLQFYDTLNNSYTDYIEENPNNIMGDVIQWNRDEFTQSTYTPLSYKIISNYKDSSGNTRQLEWEYNPLIQIPIDILSDDLTTAISGGTNDYNDSIPPYATQLDNGNYVWREIEKKGYVNPLTNVTINPPFTNNTHYIFNKIKLFIQPNLLHGNTNYVFSSISSLSQEDLGNVLGDLNGINNKC